MLPKYVFLPSVCLVFAWFCLVTLNPKPLRSLINDSASVTSHQSLLTCCLNMCFCLVFAWYLLGWGRSNMLYCTWKHVNMLPKYVFLPSVCLVFAWLGTFQHAILHVKTHEYVVNMLPKYVFLLSICLFFNRFCRCFVGFCCDFVWFCTVFAWFAWCLLGFCTVVAWLP